MDEQLVQVYLRRFIASQQCLWRDLSFDLGDLGRTFAFSLEPRSPEAPQAPKSPHGVMFVAHGTGNDSVFPHVQLFRDLLASGWVVYAFDLAGHGSRSTTLLECSSAVAVVQEALKRAHLAYPGLPLYAVGYSLGGALLARALVDTPVVAEVNYLATPVSLAHLVGPSRGRAGLRAACGELAAVGQREFYRQNAFYGTLGMIPPFGFFRRKHFPIRVAATDRAPEHYVRSVARIIDQLAVVDAVKGSTIPTRLIYGACDYVVPLAQGQILAGVCPRGRLIIIPKLTHFTLLFSESLAKTLGPEPL